MGELLKTLLDDVHSRVVEQYSKAEAVSDRTSVAWAAKTDTNMLQTWPQTSSSNRFTMPKGSSNVLPYTQGVHTPGAFTPDPSTPGDHTLSAHRTGTLTVSSMQNLCFGPVPTPTDDADIG